MSTEKDWGTPRQGKPIAWFLGGGAASGKGGLRQEMQDSGEIHPDTVVSDPNAIKDSIPEFKALKAYMDRRGAEVTHEESSLIAVDIMSRARSHRASIVVDKTLKNEGQLEEMRKFKDAGYEVRLAGMFVGDIEVAQLRAVKRGEKTGLWVSTEVIDTSHRGFAGMFEKAAEIGDRVVLFDSRDGQRPLKVARKTPDGWEDWDPLERIKTNDDWIKVLERQEKAERENSRQGARFLLDNWDNSIMTSSDLRTLEFRQLLEGEVSGEYPYGIPLRTWEP